MKPLLTIFLFAQLISHAQIIQSFSGGNDLSVGPGTAGFQFDVTIPTVINSLGVWDSTLGAGLFNAHSVGLWDAGTHVLLASTIVPAGISTVVGGFDYVSTAPLTLAAGSYVLGASYLDNDFDFAKGNVTAVITLPGITLRDALLSSGTGFEYPDLNVSGADSGFFGANAAFMVVPEPSAWALVMGFGLAGFALIRRTL